MKISLLIASILLVGQAKHLTSHHKHHHHLAAMDEEKAAALKASVSSEMDSFSKGFDIGNYRTAWKAYQDLREADSSAEAPTISTYDMYDKAFKSSRVRKSKFVRDQLDNLQEAQEKANLDMSDSQKVKEFVRQAKAVNAALKHKYGDQFVDPLENAEGKETLW